MGGHGSFLLQRGVLGTQSCLWAQEALSPLILYHLGCDAPASRGSFSKSPTNCSKVVYQCSLTTKSLRRLSLSVFCGEEVLPGCHPSSAFCSRGHLHTSELLWMQIMARRQRLGPGDLVHPGVQ